jgi:hypothetical protein
MKLSAFYIIIIFCSYLYGQENQPLYIIEGDTLSTPYVDLEEVTVLQPVNFKSYKDYLKYYRLRYRTKKVYPYAKLAAERLQVLNNRLLGIDRKRSKRRYTKRVEKFLEKEFSDELRKLTRSEGRILIKLVNRETNLTAHELIKNLRSGWRAFVYQTTAKFFDLDLKVIYDPEENEEDKLIEYILKTSFADGTLEPINIK